MKIEQIERTSQRAGRSALIDHMHGERLSYKDMVNAKCFECCNGYIDGLNDCRVPDCPLYGAMPYRDTPPPKPARTAKEIEHTAKMALAAKLARSLRSKTDSLPESHLQT